MILAAHQPQYLSWIGLCHKAARCDAFVYLDRVQYKKREFQNRNKIKTAQGPLWLTVPVKTKGRREQAIGDVRLGQDGDWARRHWQSLRHHYRGAAHFSEHADFLEDFYGRPRDFLAPTCLELDAYLWAQFKISPKIFLESEVGSEGTATERIISLCARLKARCYLSGPGGRAYLDERAFSRAGISLLYQEFAHPVYPQRFGAFEPHLAAVDLLFNCGSARARRILLEPEYVKIPGK